MPKQRPTWGTSRVTPSPAVTALAAGDIDALLAFHASVFGDTTMTQPDQPTPPAPAVPAPAVPAGYVSQETVNATVAREADAAKRKAEQDIATTLGCTVEEAKQIIAQRKADDDAKRTEAERAAEAWKTAQQGAEAIKTEAERERHEAKVERELQRAGLDVDNATLLSAALAAVGPNVQVGADAAAIKTAVEKAKTDAPQLFGAPAGSGGGGGSHTDPGGQRRDDRAPSGEFGGRGKSEAERRWGTKTA